MKRENYFFLLVVMLIAASDQITKFLVVKNMDLYETKTIIPGFFNLTLVHNRGAIFGAFASSGSNAVFFFLTMSSLVALAVIAYLFLKTPGHERLMKMALSLVLGGAIGNLTDRLSRGFVVDFLDFHIGSAHWPFFNLADLAITIGVLLIIWNLFRRKPQCSRS